MSDPLGIIQDPPIGEIRMGSRRLASRYISSMEATDWAGALEQDLAAYATKYWEIWAYFPETSEDRHRAEAMMGDLWTKSNSYHRAIEAIDQMKEDQ